jgi:Hg(II)-responsive transcriptional regulator
VHDLGHNRLTIGRLSDRTGVNIETIRYYERIGLVPSPPRIAGGHRLYDTSHRQRLVFIRRSRELGFSIDEIRALLHLARDGGVACTEAKKITVRHLGSIRGKIADLKKLERVLAALAEACDANQRRECPVLDTRIGEGFTRSSMCPLLDSPPGRRRNNA